MFVKKDTAYTTRIGPFLDKTDGVTEETGLTTAASAIFLSKNGGDYAAKNESTALSHDQDGWYIIIFDATDTNTVGELIVMIQAPATHLPVWKTYYVVEEDTYTWMFAAGSAPDTQVAAIKTDTAATLADTGTDGVIVASLAADSLTAAALATDFGDEIADQVWDEAVAGHTSAGTFGKTDADILVDTATTLNTHLTDIKTTLNGLVLLEGTIGSTGNDTTHIHIDASLAYADDELNGYFLVIKDDSTGEFHVREITDYAGAGDLATVDTLPFTPQDATDLFWVLHAQIGAGATAGTIADQVWNEARADHTTDGSTGQAMRKLLDIDVDDTTAANAGSSMGQIDDIQTDTDVIDDGTSGLVKIAQDAAAILADTGTDGVVLTSTGLNANAATEIADAVWDTDATGRQTAGTFGQAIGDPAANAETMYDAVVTDAAGTNVAADIIAVKTETALIVADTDVIDDGTSGLVKIASDVAAVLTDTGTDGVVLKAAGLNTDAVNEIVDQVWNEARSDHTTDGSTGQAMRKLLDIDVDDTTAANAGSSMGQVDDIQTDTDAILIDTGTTLDGKLPTTLVGGRIDATVDGTGMETGAIDAIFQRQMTESYNSDGTAPTLEQALMGIFQGLTEFAIATTTVTVKKLDGSTTAMTFTLDDDTDPTSRTRAT